MSVLNKITPQYLDLHLIYAQDKMGNIGKGGKLPWEGIAEPYKDFENERKADMNRFRALTRGQAVIMMRKTWDSIGGKPLPGRLNFVVTNRPLEAGPHKNTWTLAGPDFPSIMRTLTKDFGLIIGERQVWVMGGKWIYEEALKSPLCASVHVTLFDFAADGCDTTMQYVSPKSYNSGLELSKTAGEYYVYTRAENMEERGYLDLIARILGQGKLKPNRTGTPTIALTGQMLTFNLESGRFPLITTKEVSAYNVIHELLWFLKAENNIDYLKEKGIHIWDMDTSSPNLKKRGLALESGQTGPIYGIQWRNFNEQGIDQISNIIKTIRADPFNRRNILCAWNPAQLSKMCLPPCHFASVFTVMPDRDGEPETLDCMSILRSSDVGLGLPYNIASYAVLTMMIAECVGLKPGLLHLSLADAHIYENQIFGLKMQLARNPRQFPTLSFSKKIKELSKAHKLEIDDFGQDDFEISGYFPHPTIRLDMVT